MTRSSSPRSASERAGRRAAVGVPPPTLSNTRGVSDLESAFRTAYEIAGQKTKAGHDYAQAFHEVMQAAGFVRGDACTCGWAHLKRHTLACGYQSKDEIDDTTD